MRRHIQKFQKILITKLRIVWGTCSGWKKFEFISSHIYKKLYCNDGNLPRAYGSPKIHKPNCPFRVISAVDSTLYNLATFVHGLIIDTKSSKPCK